MTITTNKPSFRERYSATIKIVTIGILILLLSLSEHLKFDLAYVIGSLGIIGLITAYSVSIFKNTRLTVLMSMVLIILYGFIYILLQLQDYALLMGSIGLFVALATVMYLSGKINWYTVGLKSNGDA